jgi:hypothetical protein
MLGSTTLDTLARDLRYSLRTLIRNPGFTCAALITIALGIGANSAMFSVVEGIILAPLPFPEPERLVFLWQNRPGVPQLELRTRTSRIGNILRAPLIRCLESPFTTSISLHPGKRNTSQAFGSHPPFFGPWA